MFGAMLTWLLLRNRLNTTRARLQERLRGAEKHVAELEAAAANLEQEVSQIRQAEAVAMKQIGSLEGILTAERKVSEEKAQLLNKAEQRMLDSFRIVTGECLQESQARLTESLKNAPLDLSALNITSNSSPDDLLPLLQPLTDSLERIESRLATIEGERQNASHLLRDQIARVLETEETTGPEKTIPPVKAFPAPMPTRETSLPTQLPVKNTEPAPPADPLPPTPFKDPRPYAAANLTEKPAEAQVSIRTTPKRLSPATFLEELDTKPLPLSSSDKTFSTEEVAKAMIGGKPTSPDPETASPDSLPPVRLAPSEEVARRKRVRDVLDEELGDDFVGFEQIAGAPKKENEEIPDPKKAASDLRAALES